MNFQKATDALLSSITLQDLAGDMGVSVQSLRQARAAENSTAYRSPPEGWERAVRDLANERIGRFRTLVAHMEREIRKASRG